MIYRTTTIKQKWKEKQLYGYFKRQTSEFSHEKTYTLLRKVNFKNDLNQNSKSMLCGDKDEMTNPNSNL